MPNSQNNGSENELRHTLDKHIYLTNSKFIQIEQDMLSIKESLVERRRKEDRIAETLLDIQKKVDSIQTKLFGYKSTALAILRTTIVITTFFSALGAAIWAVVTKLYEHHS